MVQINRTMHIAWQDVADHRPQSKSQSLQFETPYQSLIDGTWAKQWQAAQAPYLPPHRINHTAPDLRCTCGKGPFRSMKLWSKHATKQQPVVVRE